MAFILHGGLAVAMSSVHPSAWAHRPPPPVELEVVDKPPPSPPPPPPEVKPEPPPPPKPVVRKVVLRPRETPPPTPPPPNQEPPPEPPPDPSPPVFGVTLDSTVTGDSAMAVPVGNTVMTPDRTNRKPGPPAPAVAEGPPAFAPAAETSIGEYPRKVKEVNADFPAEARRLGVDGQVVMRVGIDRNGVIRSVKIIKRAGYGFDDAAQAAMWKFKFTPARTKDGAAVDFLITYTYTFRDEH